MPRRTKGHELFNIKVERVDGVDRPATGRKFLLLKSEDLEQQQANTQLLGDVATELLEALAAARAPATRQLVKSANELARLVDFRKAFATDDAASMVAGDEAEVPADALEQQAAALADRLSRVDPAELSEEALIRLAELGGVLVELGLDKAEDEEVDDEEAETLADDEEEEEDEEEEATRRPKRKSSSLERRVATVEGVLAEVLDDEEEDRRRLSKQVQDFGGRARPRRMGEGLFDDVICGPANRLY